MSYNGLHVTSAAVVHRGIIYSLPPPKRHHDILRMMVEQHEVHQDEETEQGFMLSDGEFATRKAACEVAERAGQLNKHRPKTHPVRELFSEDIW